MYENSYFHYTYKNILPKKLNDDIISYFIWHFSNKFVEYFINKGKSSL
jgi:hypothetical protein